jgi:hypothetical protein
LVTFIIEFKANTVPREKGDKELILKMDWACFAISSFFFFCFFFIVISLKLNLFYSACFNNDWELTHTKYQYQYPEWELNPQPEIFNFMSQPLSQGPYLLDVKLYPMICITLNLEYIQLMSSIADAWCFSQLENHFFFQLFKCRKFWGGTLKFFKVPCENQ